LSFVRRAGDFAEQGFQVWSEEEVCGQDDDGAQEGLHVRAREVGLEWWREGGVEVGDEGVEGVEEGEVGHVDDAGKEREGRSSSAREGEAEGEWFVERRRGTG